MVDDESSRRTFELLADETRLGVISALGEASGEGGYATLAFSDLQAATGVEDNGHFNYHLQKLVGEFVEQRENGYALTLAGIRAYQAVVAQRANQTVEVDPFPIDETCDECGAIQRAWFRNGRAYIGCQSCGENQIAYPVSVLSFDPIDESSLLPALNRRLIRDYLSMFHNICPYCSGHADLSFSNDAERWQELEMLDEEILVNAACERCSWFLYASPAAMLLFSPFVFQFFRERGVDIWKESIWTDRIEWLVSEVETDPLRVHGHFEVADDRLRIVVDEDFEIVEHGGDVGELD